MKTMLRCALLLLLGARSAAAQDILIVMEDGEAYTHSSETPPGTPIIGPSVVPEACSERSPLHVVTRRDIETSGAASMADVLRDLTWNSGTDLSAELAPEAGGAAQFKLHGLPLDSTLVLRNGIRLMRSGAVSSADQAGFVDVNVVPLSLVECIQVLPPSAASRYGAEAFAGVINIVTRKRFGGAAVDLGGAWARHKQDLSVNGLVGSTEHPLHVFGTIAYLDASALRADRRDFTHTRTLSAYTWGGSIGEDSVEAPYGFREFFDVLPAQRRLAALVRLQYNLSTSVELFLEGVYATTQVTRGTSPSLPLLRHRVCLPEPSGAAPLDACARIWDGRPRTPRSRESVRWTSDTQHLVVGALGDIQNPFGAGADALRWTLTYSHARNEFGSEVRDAVYERVQEAIARGEWDPLDSDDLAPAHLFDKQQQHLRAHQQQLAAELEAPLPLPVSMRLDTWLGLELRHEQLARDVDATSEQGGYGFFPKSWDVNPQQRSVAAAHGGARLSPLAGLQLEGSGRYAPNFGETGSAGLRLRPLAHPWDRQARMRFEDALEVHGSFTAARRRPSLAQLKVGRSTVHETYTSDTFGAAVPVITPSNAELEPERARAVSAGARFRLPGGVLPRLGMFLGMDYWRLEVLDFVAPINHQQAFDARGDAPWADQQLCDGTSPDGRPYLLGPYDISVCAPLVNNPRLLAQGIDGALRLDLGLGGSDLSIGLRVSHVLSYDIRLAHVPGVQEDAVQDAAGSRNFNNPAPPTPRLRAQVPLHWTLGPHHLSLVVRYTGAYHDDRVQEGAEVQSVTTLDLQYGLTLAHASQAAWTTFKVGVQNLLDAEPPALDAILGFDPFIHDPRGRTFYARVAVEF